MKNETLSNGKTRAEVKEMINQYLLNCVDCSNYTVQGVDVNGNVIELPVICETPQQKVNFVVSCFDSEYNFPDNLKRYPNQTARFAEWLMGLPSSFNVDFENYRILEIAIEWGSLTTNAAGSRKDRIIENWFNYIAVKFFQLHEKLNKPVKAK